MSYDYFCETKILMKSSKKSVAKKYDMEFTSPLPKLLRFFTALRITANLYRPKSRANAADILFLMLNQEEYMGVRADLVMAATGHALSVEEMALVREFFTEVYGDEQLILDWLNGKINKFYFSQKKTLNMDRWKNKDVFNAIMDDNKLFGLLEEFDVL